MEKILLFLEFINEYFKINTLVRDLILYCFFDCIITVAWQKIELFHLGYTLPSGRDAIITFVASLILTMVFRKFL